MKTEVNSNKKLNIVLWVAQVLLGIMFLMTGAMKSTQPIENLATMMTWINHASPSMVRLAGVAELIGAIGLLLPSIFRIKPHLTVRAAIGLGLVMIAAILFHISIGEADMIAVPFVSGLIAIFIAWGRSKKVPISPRLSK